MKHYNVTSKTIDDKPKLETELQGVKIIQHNYKLNDLIQILSHYK